MKMAEIYSKQLKVVFVAEDLCEMREAIHRSDCMTVQQFDYESKREHNALSGRTRHNEESTLLRFSIRIDTPDCGARLYAQMKEREHHAYSFLFNTTFNGTGRIADYDDAMVAKGSIIDIEEEYSTAAREGEQEQMLMNVTLLLVSITFVGTEHNIIMNV